MGAGAAIDALRQACGEDVRDATPDDEVLGVPARWVARPASTAQTAELMRACAAHDLAVLARGAGTKLRWGSRPGRLDVLLDTTRMDGLIEHAAGDLILVTGAGRSLEAVQQDAGSAGQRLGVDPARSGTIGGAVATGATGPLRLRHGAVRDVVIGMTMVRADGVVSHSGGKVVKNVAGYDVAKLVAGSFGTLGIVTEVAFRLHPVPATRTWVCRSVAAARQAHEAVQAIVHSQLMASAVELDVPDVVTGAGTVAVLLEGSPEGVAACGDEAAELLGGDATCSPDPLGWWGVEPGTDSVSLLKVTHEIACLPGLLDTVAQSCDSTGVRASLRGSPAVGSALVAVAGPHEDDGVVSFVETLRAAAGTFGGAVVVLEAPDAARERIDVWGPVHALELMRAVKDRFDPGRILAPGRFVGGL